MNETLFQTNFSRFENWHPFNSQSIADNLIGGLWNENVYLNGTLVTDATICINETSLKNQTAYNKTSEKNSPDDFMKWQIYLKVTLIPLLFVVGLIGNTLSFLVMSSATYHRKSYSYYLRMLAVCDTITLLVYLVEEMNDMMFDAGVTKTGYLYWHTKWTCKISEFLKRSNFIMCSWLVMCFTVDRVVAVCFPLKRARLCRESVAVIVIICVTAFVLLSQTYHLYFISRLNRVLNPHQPCHAPVEIRICYLGWNYIWSNFLLRFAIPFVVLCVCNGKIVYHIEYMQSLRLTEERKRNKKSNLAIYTLYAICFTFIITLMPDSIISLIHYIAFRNHGKNSFYRPLRMLEVPFHMIRLLNYSTNFILYGLTGRQFRMALRGLFQPCTPLCLLGDVDLEVDRRNCFIHREIQPGFLLYRELNPAIQVPQRDGRKSFTNQIVKSNEHDSCVDERAEDGF